MGKRTRKIRVFSEKGKFISMTSDYAKVRQMLKSGRAVVKNKNPFSIQFKKEEKD